MIIRRAPRLGFSLLEVLLSMAIFLIALVGISLTSLLISTAPAWVTLLAWRFLGEAVPRSRLVAVALGFVGCALVAEVYDLGALHANATGVLFGLTSGLANALYIILAKWALRKYHPLTISVCALGSAALALLPLQPTPLPAALGRTTRRSSITPPKS